MPDPAKPTFLVDAYADPVLVRIRRGARHLQRAVDAVDRRAHDTVRAAHGRSTRSSSVRTIV